MIVSLGKPEVDAHVRLRVLKLKEVPGANRSLGSWRWSMIKIEQKSAKNIIAQFLPAGRNNLGYAFESPRHKK